MGRRKCTNSPLLDTIYYSSSNVVKDLVNKKGTEAFRKKILGVYITHDEMGKKEIQYHTLLKVYINTRFLNIARSKHERFGMDVTGINRSAKMREKISAYQRTRIKPPEDCVTQMGKEDSYAVFFLSFAFRKGKAKCFRQKFKPAGKGLPSV